MFPVRFLYSKIRMPWSIIVWSPLFLLLIASISSRISQVSLEPLQMKALNMRASKDVSDLTQRLCRSAFYLPGNISHINAIPIYDSKFPNKDPEAIWEVKYNAGEDKYTFSIDGEHMDMKYARNDGVDLHQSRKAPEGNPSIINAQAAQKTAINYLLEVESVVHPSDPSPVIRVNYIRLNNSYKAGQWELDCTMFLRNKSSKHYRVWLNPIDGAMDSIILMNRKTHGVTN